MAAKRGLGRGLDSLIPDRSKSEAFINKEETAAKRGKKQVKSPENKNTPEETGEQTLSDAAMAGKRKAGGEDVLESIEKKDSDKKSRTAAKTRGEIAAGEKKPALKTQVEPASKAAKAAPETQVEPASKAAKSAPEIQVEPASKAAKSAAEANSTDSKNSSENQTSTEASHHEDSQVSDLSGASAFDNLAKNENPVKAGVSDQNVVHYIRLALVEPNRDQPRKTFDEEKIDELAASIKEHGVISPILVQMKDDYYEIIAGERRWRAARKAGLKEIPAIIREYSAQEVVEISLIENIVREDLNPIEEAKAYRRLLDEFGLTQELVAQKVSRSRSAVANFLRLLNLGNEVQDMVITGAISEGHARALLSVQNHEVQKTLADQIVKGKLTVRETEKLVKSLTNPSGREKKQKNPEKEALLGSISEQLRHILGTRVAIKSSGKSRGRIEIEFYSDDDLDRLIDLLKNVQ